METYKKFIWALTIVLILLVATMLGYFFFFKSNGDDLKTPIETVKPPVYNEKQPEVKTQTEQPVNEDNNETAEPVDFTLNSSDEPVRELAQGISSHPDYRDWLNSKNLLRRLVAVVENISNGVSPGAHLEILRPRGEFKVIRKDDSIILDPKAYIRYQPVAVALASIETEQAVQLYRQLLPLFEAAYAELGYPGKNFKSALSEALDVLLSTPVVDGDILMTEKVTTYEFADPNLEGLNEAQKHLLRMGPANTRKIKAKIRDLKSVLKSQGLL